MQRIFYLSSTIYTNQEQYFILTEILHDICRLIRQTMEKYLPNVYFQVSFVYLLLQIGKHLVTTFFTNLVLNIQCNTAGYSDTEDDLICCIILINQFSNRHCIQYKTGLVFENFPGDFYFLHSDELTGSCVKNRYKWINDVNTTV